jgi:hypothetical protein
MDAPQTCTYVYNSNANWSINAVRVYLSLVTFTQLIKVREYPKESPYYSSLIAKHVLATYINHFRFLFLELTSTGVLLGIMVVTRLELEHIIPGLKARHLNH